MDSTNTSKKVVWQCKTYIINGKDTCDAKTVDEIVLMNAFVRMFNGIYGTFSMDILQDFKEPKTRN